jgi:hypothetical protein
MPKNKPVRKKKQVYELVDNVVKLNISSLLFRTFSLQFEKKINRSKTFALGVIYRPNFPTPFVQDLLNDTSFTASAETRNLLESSRFSTWMITPEFRFYFKKKAPRGLYLAPFLRFKHRTYSSEFQYQESSVGSSLKTGIYKNQANIVGAGILFGLQILAKNKMTIDFWFLGPWAGVKFSKNSSKINAGSLNEYDKAYIESVTEGYNRLFGFANSYQWTKSGFGNSGTQFGAGLRLCGINFGYSF